MVTIIPGQGVFCPAVHMTAQSISRVSGTKKMTKKNITAIALILLSSVLFADPRILPMRERAVVIDRWLTIRVQTVLPELMRRSGIDMWVIISREYNEDPVIRTFLPSKWQSARRRTILLVYDPGEGEPLETLAVARYAVGEMFEKA